MKKKTRKPNKRSQPRTPASELRHIVYPFITNYGTNSFVQKWKESIRAQWSGLQRPDRASECSTCRGYGTRYGYSNQETPQANGLWHHGEAALAFGVPFDPALCRARMERTGRCPSRRHTRKSASLPFNFGSTSWARALSQPPPAVRPAERAGRFSLSRKR